MLLIRTALWLHIALFTLFSLTHSCHIVTKEGEASGPSSSPPLWPTVSLTSWSQSWVIPWQVYRRMPAKQNPNTCENVGAIEKKNILSAYLAQLWRMNEEQHAFPNELRIKFPTMPCWHFMARFHINLSTPSQQMGFRIYAFLQQWCYQSGKPPLDGRRDNKRGVRLDQYHSAHSCSANSIQRCSGDWSAWSKRQEDLRL